MHLMAILSHTEQDLLDWLFTLFDSGQPRNMAMASMETMQEQSDMIGMARSTSLPQKRGWEDEIGAGLTDKKWLGWDCTNLWTQKWPGWDCTNFTYSGLWWVLTVDTLLIEFIRALRLASIDLSIPYQGKLNRIKVSIHLRARLSVLGSVGSHTQECGKYGMEVLCTWGGFVMGILFWVKI